jgi:hypothetical protein
MPKTILLKAFDQPPLKRFEIVSIPEPQTSQVQRKLMIPVFNQPVAHYYQFADTFTIEIYTLSRFPHGYRGLLWRDLPDGGIELCYTARSSIANSVLVALQNRVVDILSKEGVHYKPLRLHFNPESALSIERLSRQFGKAA